eukprot:TRINITY_DN4792_c0_g1_i1.p1 TRINITY_DN4792_c0_g1~~TRINITY_DN4792_c0_g1_i1.p1  ORF type:complete len:189 (-),score=20.91 TRINITY_DN4792_c0_g1_i1:71-637(-)
MFSNGSPCTGLAISPEEEFIFVSYLSGAVRIINISTEEIVQTFTPEQDTSVQSLNLDAERLMLFCTTSSGNVYVYDVSDLSVLPPLVSSWSAHSSYILSSCLSSDYRYFATTSADNTVRIWDGDSYELLMNLEGHTKWVWECCFAGESNELLLSVSSDATIMLWDWSKGEKLKDFLGGKPVCCIAYSK